MALDDFVMRKAHRGQLGFGEQRKIEALELIADALLEVKGELSDLNRNIAIISKDNSPGIFGRK